MSSSSGGPDRLRGGYHNQVLEVLRTAGPLTRAELVQRVGLSRTTLTQVVADLVTRAAVVAVDVAGPVSASPRVGRGRPAGRLSLNPRAGAYVGLDFGHRRVRAVVVNAAHDVVGQGLRPYAARTSWPARLGAATGLLDELGGDGIGLSSLTAIGAGIPGPFSPRLPAAPVADPSAGDSTPARYVQDILSARFDVPVMVDNNTRFAALAEAIWGRGARSRDLVYARLSDGVGGGLVVDGRLVTGSAGFAGELGHVSVVPDGPTCRCGKRGCLETLVSVPAILDRCSSAGAPLADLTALAQAVSRSDPIVDRVLRDAGAALGRVLGMLAVALDPVEIVVGGEIGRIAPSLLDQAQTTLSWEMLPIRDRALRVRPAELGDDDGALGAVAAILHSSPLLAAYPQLPAPDLTRSERDAS